MSLFLFYTGLQLFSPFFWLAAPEKQRAWGGCGFCDVKLSFGLTGITVHALSSVLETFMFNMNIHHWLKRQSGPSVLFMISCHITASNVLWVKQRTVRAPRLLECVFPCEKAESNILYNHVFLWPRHQDIVYFPQLIFSKCFCRNQFVHPGSAPSPQLTSASHQRSLQIRWLIIDTSGCTRYFQPPVLFS